MDASVSVETEDFHVHMSTLATTTHDYCQINNVPITLEVILIGYTETNVFQLK